MNILHLGVNFLMKLLIFRRKKFRRIDLTLIILFIIISLVSNYSGHLNFLDLDDDNHLSAWIESIEFTNKTNWDDFIDSNETSVEFSIDFEIWNPGPFRIQYPTNIGSFCFPYSITQSGNSTFFLKSYGIFEIDVGIMFYTSSKISPGIHHFQLTEGLLNFNGSVPESNPYLPDGDYRFTFGNNQWIRSDNYDVNVSNGIISHSPSEKPLLWGESTTNLGNPHWYLFGLPLLALIITEWVINAKKGLPIKQNP